MRKPDASRGICDRCDEPCYERYIYEFMSPYGRTYDLLCEDCYPKCQMCGIEFEFEEDMCDACNQAILAAEDDEPTISEIAGAA